MSSACFGFLFHSIDCAGILKLRNADIELKKGETDIGRKNTRVRVVFRVAVPRPDGRMLWLQTTSVPVECCASPVILIHHIYIEFFIQRGHQHVTFNAEQVTEQVNGFCLFRNQMIIEQAAEEIQGM